MILYEKIIKRFANNVHKKLLHIVKQNVSKTKKH